MATHTFAKNCDAFENNCIERVHKDLGQLFAQCVFRHQIAKLPHAQQPAMKSVPDVTIARARRDRHSVLGQGGQRLVHERQQLGQDGVGRRGQETHCWSDQRTPRLSRAICSTSGSLLKFMQDMWAHANLCYHTSAAQ